MSARKPTAYLAVHAKPKAKMSRLVGYKAEALEIALAAPPVDGAANEELLRFLADLLSHPKRDLEIASGAGSRHKRVAIYDLPPAELQTRLARLLGS
jgi:uncharacterized protein